MNVFDTIKRNRRIILGGAVAVYAIAALALVGGVTSGSIELYRAISLAIAATLPATLAVISLQRRPTLLTAAWMSAVVSAVALITVGWIWIVVAIAWGYASGRRPRPAPDARWMTWARPVLALAVVLPIVVMFAHLDPVCTVTSSDGTVENIDPASRGYAEGWQLGGSFFAGGSTTSTSASSASVAGSTTETEAETFTSEECSSDTVVWWEALASVATSAAVVGVASRWPTSEQLVTEDEPTLV